MARTYIRDILIKVSTYESSLQHQRQKLMEKFSHCGKEKVYNLLRVISIFLFST